ncbi:MAG: hypothetical protein ACYCQI_04435 [Gammaproteobacteria bacterium]
MQRDDKSPPPKDEKENKSDASGPQQASASGASAVPDKSSPSIRPTNVQPKEGRPKKKRWRQVPVASVRFAPEPVGQRDTEPVSDPVRQRDKEPVSEPIRQREKASPVVRESKHAPLPKEDDDDIAAHEEIMRYNTAMKARARLDTVTAELKTICDGISRLNKAIESARNSYSLLIQCERDERKLQQDITMGLLKTVLSVFSMAAALEAAQAGTGLAFLSASMSRAVEQSAPTTLVGVEQAANPLVQDAVATFQEDHLHQDDADKQTKDLSQSIYMINDLILDLHKLFEKFIDTTPKQNETKKMKEERRQEIREAMDWMRKFTHMDPQNGVHVNMILVNKRVEMFNKVLDSKLAQIPEVYYKVLLKLGSTPHENIAELKKFDKYELRRNNAKYLTRDYYKPAPDQAYALVEEKTPRPGFVKLARIGQPGVHYEFPAFLNPAVDPTFSDDEKERRAARQRTVRLMDPHPQGESYLIQKAGYRKTRVGSKSLRKLVWSGDLLPELSAIHRELQIVSGKKVTYKHSGIFTGKWDKSVRKDRMRDLWRSHAILTQVFDCNGKDPPILKSAQQISNSILEIFQIEAYFIRNGQYNVNHSQAEKKAANPDILKMSPLCLLRKIPDYQDFLKDPVTVKLLKDQLTPEFILTKCLTNHNLATEKDVERLYLALENMMEFMKIIPGIDHKVLEKLEAECIKYIEYQKYKSQAKLLPEYTEPDDIAEALTQIATDENTIKWGGVEVQYSEFLDNVGKGRASFEFNRQLSSSNLFPEQEEVKSDKDKQVEEEKDEKGMTISVSPADPGLGLMPRAAEPEPSQTHSSSVSVKKLSLPSLGVVEDLETDRSARAGLPNVLKVGNRAATADEVSSIVIQQDEKGRSVVVDRRKTSTVSITVGPKTVSKDSHAQQEPSAAMENKEGKQADLRASSAARQSTSFLLNVFDKKAPAATPPVSADKEKSLKQKVIEAFQRKKTKVAPVPTTPPEGKASPAFSASVEAATPTVSSGILEKLKFWKTKVTPISVPAGPPEPKERVADRKDGEPQAQSAAVRKTSITPPRV